MAPTPKTKPYKAIAAAVLSALIAFGGSLVSLSEACWPGTGTGGVGIDVRNSL